VDVPRSRTAHAKPITKWVVIGLAGVFLGEAVSLSVFTFLRLLSRDWKMDLVVFYGGQAHFLPGVNPTLTLVANSEDEESAVVPEKIVWMQWARRC
jgi:hypothetical protein